MESVTSLTKKYSKEAVNATLSRIQTLIKDHGLSNVKIVIFSIYFADEGNFFKNKTIRCTIKLSLAKKPKVAELRKKLELNSELAEVIKIVCCEGEGEQFHPIEIADRPQIGEEEDLTISHTEGTVLLVNFWENSCVMCEQFMSYNQEMLLKNESKWGSKVHVVGVSLDQDRDQLAKRIKERGWDKVEHYILPGSWKHPGPQIYGCNNVPHVVLADQLGKIVYSGHPEDTHLEEEINQLLPEKPIRHVEKTRVEKGVPAEKYKKLRCLIKEGRLNFISKVYGQEGVFRIFALLQHKKELNADLQVALTNQEPLVIDAFLAPELVETFTKDLAAATKETSREYINNKIRVMNTVKIEFGTSCTSCSKILTEKDAQYYSYHDRKYFCKFCGEREDNTKFGINKYLNPHALVYLHVKNSSAIKEVMEHRIGNQLQPKTKYDEKRLKGLRGYFCQVCKGAMEDIEGFRCLNCMDIDFCGQCHKKLEGRDLDLDQKLKSRGHDVDSHILQRYCFAEDCIHE